MNEKIFDVMLTDALRADSEAELVLLNSNADKPHIFSGKFERNMRKIMPAHIRFVRTARRFTAVAAACVICFALGANVDLFKPNFEGNNIAKQYSGGSTLVGSDEVDVGENDTPADGGETADKNEVAGNDYDFTYDVNENFAGESDNANAVQAADSVDTAPQAEKKTDKYFDTEIKPHWLPHGYTLRQANYYGNDFMVLRYGGWNGDIVLCVSSAAAYGGGEYGLDNRETWTEGGYFFSLWSNLSEADMTRIRASIW